MKRMEYENLTLLQFAELLSSIQESWAKEFYWAAVEADKGNLRAIRELVAAFAQYTEDGIRWREFKDAVGDGEFAPDTRNRLYRRAVEDVNSLLDEYIQD
ncbi:MAG: hypothetical protein H0T57_11570 [Rubrobacter sp.]|nr:hypothetical protein [Rubrobacter sp.]